MKKKRFASSARGERVGKRGKPTADEGIDFSDIPESTDEELAKARRVGRPKSPTGPRQLIAIRIDPELLVKLRKMAAKSGKPYQTLIHQLLERAAKRMAS